MSAMHPRYPGVLADDQVVPHALCGQPVVIREDANRCSTRRIRTVTDAMTGEHHWCDPVDAAREALARAIQRCGCGAVVRHGHDGEGDDWETGLPHECPRGQRGSGEEDPGDDPSDPPSGEPPGPEHPPWDLPIYRREEYRGEMPE